MFFNLETVAVVLALLYVVLAIRENPWCWPASALGATIYMVLFFEGQLLMESLLQFFYVLLALYGLWAWRFNAQGSQGAAQGAATPLSISTRPLRWHTKMIALILLITAAVSVLLSRFTAADAVVIDSLTTVASLFTTWMVAKKIVENWLYWLVIDAIYVYLFAVKGFFLTALLYTLFLGMAAYGYRAWKKQSTLIEGG